MVFYWRSFVYLPIVILVFVLGGFFVCYGIGVNPGNFGRPSFWPYVSDTGVKPPERGIFTMILTWGAFIGLAIMFLYFKYVLHHGHATKCNLAALIVGVITCFGITLVGSFQWDVALVPHLVGAFAAFIGAMIYSWMLVYITIKHMSYTGCGRGIIYCRVMIAVVEILSFIFLIIGIILIQVRGNEYLNYASISEWFLIYSAIIFVGTLAFELNNIHQVDVKLELHSAQIEEV